MNGGELKKLLEKYYNGESTEEEELRLRDFFNAKNTPTGFDTDRAIFQHYTIIGDIPEPSKDFESRIMARVDTSGDNLLSGRIRKYIFPVISTAACLLILAGSYLLFVHKSENEDTFNDPKMAYAETVRILADISSKLNNGARALEPVGKMNKMTKKSLTAINKSALIIGKSLNNLDQLENLNEDRD